MKKRNNSYWEDRANLRMAQYHKDSDTTIQKITAAYDNAIKDINSDIEDIVNNYKLSGDLTDKELKRLLNTKITNPIRKLMQRILPRVESKNIRKYLISRLNAEPYKARITRLEALKQSCYINSKLVADVELRESTKLYTNTIKKAYYTNLFNIQKGLGIGFNVAQMPTETIQEILKNNWSGSHYSERIWHNTDVLANKLEEIITTGLMTGKSSRRMADELQDMTDCGKFAAERLIRTETTYISNMADMEAYEECDVDKYVFVATLDLRTSNVCREHDGKVYEVKKAIAGDNLPPLHPHCRSTTIAYFGEETLSNMERRARDPETGDTYKVPAYMDYEEWHDKFVVDRYGKDKAEAMEKMVKNKASDKEQLKRYQEILEEEAPKSLEEFQQLKYNNSKEWEELKLKYKDYKDKDLAIFTEDLPIPEDRKRHIWLGENRFLNPKKPEKGGGILKGGGHGQGAIDSMEEHYAMMEARRGIISDKKFEKAIQELGFEYKEYENGVRLGNIFGASDEDKAFKWGQAWFPSDWTEDDIYEAGQYILKVSDKKLFQVKVSKKGNVVSKIDKYAEYRGISIGVTVNYKDGEPFIGTIFPDKEFRFNKNIKEKENSYYKKGERKKEW